MATLSKASSLTILTKYDRLRWLVAILGSKMNAAWWDCSFMDETGIKFLANSFPRSAEGAAFHATTEAAQRVHDAALGRIGCYHLFRLPLTIEDRLLEVRESNGNLPTKNDALAELASMADSAVNAPDGPVQIGIEKKILTETALRELAAHYYSAFSKGTRCYPYFSAEA
jgi:hypothetical protein